MNFVAVTPMPEAPNTMKIFIVERIIPNCPNNSLPSILAHAIPAINTHNLPAAVPVNDQNAPPMMRRAMSEVRRVAMIFLTLFLWIKVIIVVTATEIVGLIRHYVQPFGAISVDNDEF